MRLVGGHPAVDFVNTLGGRKDAPDDEYLHAYGDLLVWSERSGLMDLEAADTLARTADLDAVRRAEVDALDHARSRRTLPGRGRAPRSSAPSGRSPTP